MNILDFSDINRCPQTVVMNSYQIGVMYKSGLKISNQLSQPIISLHGKELYNIIHIISSWRFNRSTSYYHRQETAEP